MSQQRKPTLAIIGPGILVAATGVGAGDLATGAFTGAKLGVAVLWAVALGAAVKFLLNEGLARWQLATGTTLLEGCVTHLGRIIQWIFLPFLIVWSFFVSAALMSACGVTAQAILPWFSSPEQGKMIHGAAHSILGVILIWRGGYRLFERVMNICIAVMFCVTVATAVALRPSLIEILQGIFVPRIPDWRGEGLTWTVALMGGVGGTVTVLCYGYWIREEGREGPDSLSICRIDLATGYVVTAIFGMAMVIIASRIGAVQGGGAGLIVQLADSLEQAFPRGGTVARYAFLAGAWGAVFSSLLGVWQSVPYLFADLWQLIRRQNASERRTSVDTTSWTYRGYMLFLAIVPMLGLAHTFVTMQKVYAIVGAVFIPLLACALLYLNGSGKLIGAQHRNSVAVNLLLIGALLLSLAASGFAIVQVNLG